DVERVRTGKRHEHGRRGGEDEERLPVDHGVASLRPRAGAERFEHADERASLLAEPPGDGVVERLRALAREELADVRDRDLWRQYVTAPARHRAAGGSGRAGPAEAARPRRHDGGDFTREDEASVVIAAGARAPVDGVLERAGERAVVLGRRDQ